MKDPAAPRAVQQPIPYESRRQFLKTSSLTAGALLLSPIEKLTGTGLASEQSHSGAQASESGSADYTLHIKASPAEIAPKRIISATTYNGQFPGPLLRFKEGRRVTVEIYNDTDTREQLHWHGQKGPTDVDGASRRARRLFPRTVSAASCSRRGRRAFVFTIPTIAQAHNCMPDNTTAHSGPL